MQQFGWQYNAAGVAALERISLAEAYNLPYIQFLNGLAYLKALRAYEKELNNTK